MTKSESMKPIKTMKDMKMKGKELSIMGKSTKITNSMKTMIRLVRRKLPRSNMNQKRRVELQTNQIREDRSFKRREEGSKEHNFQLVMDKEQDPLKCRLGK